MPDELTIRPVRTADADTWLSLRLALWPDGPEQEHRREIEAFLARRALEPQAVLVAEDRTGRVVGLAELSIRSCAEGCRSNRVAYLEGWFVIPEMRGRGVGRALVGAAEQWGLATGCREFASDTQIGNPASAAAHRALGFTEVGLIRCFRKDL